MTELRSFDEHSAAALVLALDQDNRIELTPQNVVDDFRPDSEIARLLLGALWHHLDSSLNKHVNRIEMLFSEWKDLFEQSTNLGAIGRLALMSTSPQLDYQPERT